ncbi:hypothetical protein KI387_002334, partial [Taxus chinensis]
DKKSRRARIKLPNVKALGFPLDLILCYWLELRATAGDAFEHLWRGWLKAVSFDEDTDMELGLDQNQSTRGISISVDDVN